jgi:hypothetical protein
VVTRAAVRETPARLPPRWARCGSPSPVGALAVGRNHALPLGARGAARGRGAAPGPRCCGVARRPRRRTRTRRRRHPCERARAHAPAPWHRRLGARARAASLLARNAHWSAVGVLPRPAAARVTVRAPAASSRRASAGRAPGNAPGKAPGNVRRPRAGQPSNSTPTS